MGVARQREMSELCSVNIFKTRKSNIMKNAIFTMMFVLGYIIPSFGQVQLDVAGNAKIAGQLELYAHPNDTTSIIIGKNAGTLFLPSGEQNNIFIGNLSGHKTTETNNVFIGAKTGVENTEGNSNTFIGFNAGNKNSNGSKNVFLGNIAGGRNETGRGNTFLGVGSGYTNTSGNNNVYLGKDAGFLAHGSHNVFIGYLAGFQNEGLNNVFIGSSAGWNNKMGAKNTFVGNSSGATNTTGEENTFVGNGSGASNARGKENTFIGKDAGFNNQDAEDNTFVGNEAGNANTDGNNNTYIGQGAGFQSTTGHRNTFLGELAGFNNVSGSDLTMVGHNVNSLADNTDNAFAIGNYSNIPHSNMGTIGNVSTQEIGGYVNWGTISDQRIKKRVKEDVRGLDFVMQLRPVSYNIDTEKLANALLPKDIGVEEEKEIEISPIYEEALKEKSRIRYTGFIAQEVEAAAKRANFDFSGIVKPAHERDHYSIRYAEFVVPLVKATQEQEEKIKSLQDENEHLKDQIYQLTTRLEQLELSLQKNATTEDRTPQTAKLPQKAFLAQNYPNPFKDKTVIEYFIPQYVQSAFIQITTIDGKVVQKISIVEKEAGQIAIKTNSLSKGNYFYTLILDGTPIETRQMNK